MIDQLPTSINGLFLLTAFLGVWLFYKASFFSRQTMGLVLIWLSAQAFVGISGFYTNTDVLPPRFLLLIGPPFALILILFSTPRGRERLDKFNEKTLTYLHMVRVPVELVLYALYIYGQVPELMTFEGRNFDILAGITAPLVAYFGYHKRRLPRPVLLTWNIACLGLLLNIVIHAILSAPFAFQQLAFDQPNVGVLYFPFVWLPGFIVPVVLFSHLVCIRNLVRGGTAEH